MLAQGAVAFCLVIRWGWISASFVAAGWSGFSLLRPAARGGKSA